MATSDMSTNIEHIDHPREQRHLAAPALLAGLCLLVACSGSRRERPRGPRACRKAPRTDDSVPLVGGALTPFGSLPAKYSYPSPIVEPTAIVDEEWNTIVSNGEGEYTLDSGLITPSKSLLLFAPDQTVVLQEPLRAKNVVIYAQDLKIADSGEIDVSATGTPTAPPTKPSVPTSAGAAGVDGQPGTAGQSGGMIVLMLKSSDALRATAPTDRATFKLSGQDGGQGQPGGDGAPGTDLSASTNNGTCGRHYSAGWDRASFNTGLEQCRGPRGGAGGRGGSGGAGGRGGDAGTIYLMEKAAEAESKILAGLEATPGVGGASGPAGSAGIGGAGGPGGTFTVRHCWKTAFWTDCKDEGRQRGYTGHRGPTGAPAPQGPSVGPSGASFQYPAKEVLAPSETSGLAQSSWMTSLLEHLEERALILSERGDHDEAAHIADSTVEFHSAVAARGEVWIPTARDSNSVLSMLRIREALRAGLSASGELQTQPNALDLIDVRELGESVRFEASTFSRRRELYVRLLRADGDSGNSAEISRLLSQQLALSQAETEARLLELRSISNELESARSDYEKTLGLLDEQVEAHFGAKMTELSTEQWETISAAHHGDLVQMVSSLAAVGIAAATGGAAAPFLATAVSYGGTVAARAIRKESLVQFSDIGNVYSTYSQFKIYNSKAEQKKREKRRLDISRAKGMKRAELIFKYAKADKEALSRAIGQVEASARSLLADGTTVAMALAEGESMSEETKTTARELVKSLNRIERLHQTAAALTDDVSRQVELQTWLIASISDAADAATRATARRQAARSLWKVDAVKSTRVRRSLTAYRAYGEASQPPQLTQSWDEEELEYTKLLDALTATVPTLGSRPALSNNRELSHSVGVGVPWRTDPRSEYTINIGGAVGLTNAVVECVSVSGLREVRAYVERDEDYWLQDERGNFSHFVAPIRTFGVLSSDQPEYCFAENLVAPALIGQWKLRLEGTNSGLPCEQEPLVVEFRTRSQGN